MDENEAIRLAQEYYRSEWGSGQPGQVLRVRDLAAFFADRVRKGEDIPARARATWGGYMVVWFRDPNRREDEIGVLVEKTTGATSFVVAD